MPTRTKPKSTLTIREAEQGYACQCAACLSGDDNELFSRLIFCAQCGHGYIDLRTGRDDDKRMGCTKCGAVGQFAEIRPALTAPPPQTFRVRFTRLMRESAEIEVIASTTYAAVDAAQRRIADGDGGEWRQVSPNPVYAASFEAVERA